MRRRQYFVYMVSCADGTFYTGSTNNLENRLKLHNAGRGAKYLRGKAPIEIVYAKKCANLKMALGAEHALKKLNRKQKEKLVEIYVKKKRRGRLKSGDVSL